MYKVISDFRDLRDNGHQYKTGDVYPHSGDADITRAKHLMTPTIQRGPLIKEVDDEKPASKTTTKKRSKKED